MIHTAADDFMADIKRLCATEVNQQQWNTFLDAWVSPVDDKGEPLTGRCKTMAQNKRAILKQLYAHDNRVAPWAGTAHGVLQAVNTMEHHEGIVRGATRAERNMLRTVTGDFGSLDRTCWATLSKVLG